MCQHGNVATRSSVSVNKRIICIHELHQDQLNERKLWPMSTNLQGSTLRLGGSAKDSYDKREKHILIYSMQIKTCFKQY